MTQSYLISIKCQSQVEALQGTLYYTSELARNSRFSVHLVCDKLGHFLAIEYNIFDALCRLRAVLEPFGFLICCNGARRDSWASGLAKDMGGGKRVYLTRGGHRATTSDLVATLAPADCSKCVRLSVQLMYHIQWIRSVVGEEAMSTQDLATPNQLTYDTKLRANGFVFKLEGGINPSDSVVPNAVMGAWEVGGDGTITGSFIPNLRYAPRAN